MKSTRTLIAFTAAALLPLAAAVAADNDQYGKDKSAVSDQSFKKLDTNSDGRISQAEAAADSTLVFSSADRNSDGYLDGDEFKSASKGGMNTPQSEPSDPAAAEPTPAPDTATPGQ